MTTQEALNKPFLDNLLRRFLRYVQICSQSSELNAEHGLMPSSPDEWEMAKVLCEELTFLGLENVHTTDDCYTYAFLPASEGLEDKAPFCLLAHIDTVDEVSGRNVRPQIHRNFAGGKIEFEDGDFLDSADDEYLALAAKERDTIITSSGDTLLGADDKAGVSEIMTAVEFLVHNPQIKHGPIEIIFSPDEETGHGMDRVPLDLLKSTYAYTVDGGHIGELETECFNAYKSEVTFLGKSVHTGSARGKLINAVSMASAFVDSLPRQEMPETTDGYMGFYAPMGISGSIEKAVVSLILRDFSLDGIEKRKATVDLIAQGVEASFGGKVFIRHSKQYLNMKEQLDKNPMVVDNLISAYKRCGLEPKFVPIRGGTDGSRLTEMGIPCPNIFTGGHNFHSRFEWASLSQMSVATSVLIELIKGEN